VPIDGRTDEQLVIARQGGDRPALGDIQDRYADGLHDTAPTMLPDRHEAAGAVQEVFVAVQRSGSCATRSRCGRGCSSPCVPGDNASGSPGSRAKARP